MTAYAPKNSFKRVFINDNNSNNKNSRLYRILQLNTTSTYIYRFGAFWHMRIITQEQNVIKIFKIKIFADRLIFTTKKKKKVNLT